MSKKILITGANRGLGLGFVKSSLDRGYTVFAGCRIPDKAEELQELENNFKERLFIISLDPTKLDSIQRAVAEIKSKTNSLDILVNNAGINSKSDSFTTGETASRANARNVSFECNRTNYYGARIFRIAR